MVSAVARNFHYYVKLLVLLNLYYRRQLSGYCSLRFWKSGCLLLPKLNLPLIIYLWWRQILDKRVFSTASMRSGLSSCGTCRPSAPQGWWFVSRFPKGWSVLNDSPIPDMVSPGDCYGFTLFCGWYVGITGHQGPMPMKPDTRCMYVFVLVLRDCGSFEILLNNLLSF